MLNLLKNIGRNLVSRPATRPYPFVQRAPGPGTRGHIDMDIEVCIFCGACQRRCPANAIAVTRKPNPKSWTLDPYACILCGYCVEVCPVHCIHMRPDHRKPVP